MARSRVALRALPATERHDDLRHSGKLPPRNAHADGRGCPLRDEPAVPRAALVLPEEHPQKAQKTGPKLRSVAFRRARGSRRANLRARRTSDPMLLLTRVSGCRNALFQFFNAKLREISAQVSLRHCSSPSAHRMGAELCLSRGRSTKDIYELNDSRTSLLPGSFNVGLSFNQ